MNSDVKNRDDIKILVDSFYERAGKDELLGSIFHQLNFYGTYKETLYRYWEDTLLNPQHDLQRELPTHIGLMFSPQHFIRWSRLFLENLDSLYSGPNADKAKTIIIKKSEEFQTSLEIFRF